MFEVLLCSNNPGKVAEVQTILGDSVRVLSLKERGIDLNPVEDGETIEENALKKAREGHVVSKMPTIADDTGLFIDAFGGEPGRHVRRWPGHTATDEELVDYTLERMKDMPEGERTATFRTAVAYVSDTEGFVVTGEVKGRITDCRTAAYREGLPFDTLFFVEEVGKTFADMGEQKHIVSHRARALHALHAAFMERSLTK